MTAKRVAGRTCMNKHRARVQINVRSLGAPGPFVSHVLGGEMVSGHDAETHSQACL